MAVGMVVVVPVEVHRFLLELEMEPSMDLVATGAFVFSALARTREALLASARQILVSTGTSRSTKFLFQIRYSDVPLLAHFVWNSQRLSLRRRLEKLDTSPRHSASLRPHTCNRLRSLHNYTWNWQSLQTPNFYYFELASDTYRGSKLSVGAGVVLAT